ncbi:MAG: type II toxin-antitoxin system VapC family toxin [Gemmatimonadales bacterium]
MITAVDSNVLLDVFGGRPHFLAGAQEALRASVTVGRLTACDVVWAEVAAFFPAPEAAQAAMDLLGVEYDPLTPAAALAAGAPWQDYRRRGGHRTRVVPDFLIGAHAAQQADRLLTRDRGFYRSYFRHLTILDPAHR